LISICHKGEIFFDIQEDHGEPPDFKIQSRRQKFLESEWIKNSVTSIFVYTSNDELAFPFVQELPAFVGSVREVDEEEITSDANDTGDLSSVLAIFLSYISAKLRMPFSRNLSVNRENIS